jgi:hypothetical protein
MGKEMICKRDGRVMYLVEEAEKMSDGTARLTFYYRCPVCGYRVPIEQCIMESDKDGIIIKCMRRT